VQQALGVEGFVADGEDEGGRQGFGVAEPFDEGPAVAVAEIEIEHEQVGAEGGEAGDGGGAAVGLADDGEVGVLLDGGTQSESDEGVVVDQENVEGLAHA
jgi:hypothetical protein